MDFSEDGLAANARFFVTYPLRLVIPTEISGLDILMAIRRRGMEKAKAFPGAR